MKNRDDWRETEIDPEFVKRSCALTNIERGGFALLGPPLVPRDSELFDQIYERIGPAFGIEFLALRLPRDSTT